MGRSARGQFTKKQLTFGWISIIVLIGLIVLGDVLASFAAVTAHDRTPLGTWRNFPNSSTCDLTVGFPFNIQSPKCELMGNSTYRDSFPVFFGFVGMQAALSVSCISPSNTVGAVLALQYALFNQSTNTNSSTWQTLGSVPIDNSANEPCPGNLVGLAAPLNMTSGVGYIFRAVGADGGGAGDSPRFSQVGVTIFNSFQRIFTAKTVNVGGATFTVTAYSSIPESSPKTIVMNWFATNASSTNPGCGTNAGGGTDHCWEKGSANCMIPITGDVCNPSTTVTYTTAFTGSVRVFTQLTTTPENVTLVNGELGLLKVQTSTV